MDEKDQDTRQLILAIGFNHTQNNYEINIPQGSNLNEVAFGISAMIKCLLRDAVLKEPQEFLELIVRYLTDPQYNELEGDNNVSGNTDTDAAETTAKA